MDSKHSWSAINSRKKLTSIQKKNAEKEHLIPKTFHNESVFYKRITHIASRLAG